ncbi:MAG TPA: hypothetical protein VFJ07_12175 [Streptosporangiaceae bacterium]|nr:hypothetical protein [Streptosporangiaceae bacterium]
MNTVLDRLTDAMSAAAGTVRDEELRPLTLPERRRRQSPWAAPVAAAAAMVLVIGLAVSVSNGLFGRRQSGGVAHLPAAPHPYYLATDLGTWKTAVRSTATGKVIAVVPVPSLKVAGTVSPALASAGNGTFYIAAFERGVRSEQIYRFRLTAAGHVTGFARVPGGTLRPGWAADALAASADGSRVAVGAYYYPDHGHNGPQRSDQLVVISTATGAQHTWRGGSPARGYRFFRAASLSWADDTRELAVLGEWCKAASDPGGEGCPRWERQAQLRAINPARPGGSVLTGRLLLRQAPRTYLAQALVSPDGAVITAMVLRGKIAGNPDISGIYPQNMSVEQISTATGHLLGVIYQRDLGDTSSVSGPMSNPLTLIADAAGSNLILDGGICDRHCSNEFNGWLHGATLVPLRPAGFAHREAAEAW